jgi:homoserine O-succinyltransferase
VVIPLDEAPSPGLRVAIINIMPRAEAYEEFLRRPLLQGRPRVDPIWVRLRSHAYGSSDLAHIAGYVTFAEALRRGRIDGIILTGAPVEELEFDQVHYWPELVEILGYARRHVSSTLGLCWGGLALGKMLGLEKRKLPRKLFGVYQNRTVHAEHPLTSDFDDQFWCAHSRHSGIPDGELTRAADEGVVNLLSHGVETGYSLFESADHRFVAHLGHPEYEPSRLVYEWERDSSLGRMDVAPPANFDPKRPANVWRSHRNELFRKWLALLTQTSASGAK